MKKALLIALALVNTTSLYAATTNFKCFVMSRNDDVRNIRTATNFPNKPYTYSITDDVATVTYASGAVKKFKAKLKEINLDDYKGLASLRLEGRNVVNAFIIDELSKKEPTVIVNKEYKREEHTGSGFKKYNINFGEIKMANVYPAKPSILSTLACIKL